MPPSRQTRTVIDPAGRRWTAQLNGWGAAMGGDPTRPMDQPSTCLLIFEFNGEIRRTEVSYDTRELGRWDEAELLDALRRASS